MYDLTSINHVGAKRCNTQYAPKALSLHRLTSRFASRLYEAFDIDIPSLNAAPILWRVVQECFCSTRTLASLHK